MFTKNDQKNVIARYIKAKDENKPHLMAGVFTESATLEIRLDTNAVSFPSGAAGLLDITKTLITDFNHTYENVYTICLEDSFKQKENVLTCNWLVGMSEKETGTVRIGCGEYKWCFKEGKVCLVEHLTIKIEEMIVLPREALIEVMAWLEKLSAPWTSSEGVLESMPDIALLSSVRTKIA